MPDELGELAAAANAMIGRLRYEEAARDQAEAAHRDLVAAVSHDLRTPITSLRLLAEAVGDDIVDGEVRRGYLDRMRVHIDALSALIDDLFELSRLEAGDIRWSLEQVPLGELVGETVAAMRVQADAKGVAVVTEMPDALLPARANPEKLQRVLFNLIQNAIRHTPADGSVVVRAEPVAGRIEIEIADTGEGIAPDQRAARVHGVLSRRPTRPAPARGPGSGSRSRARSWRPTAGGSGSSTRPWARGCASACRWRQRPPRRGGQLRLDRGVSCPWTAASAPGGPRRQLHLDPGGRVVADHPVKPPSAQLAAAVREAHDVCPGSLLDCVDERGDAILVALLLGEHGHAIGPSARDLGKQLFVGDLVPDHGK